MRHATAVGSCSRRVAAKLQRSSNGGEMKEKKEKGAERGKKEGGKEREERTPRRAGCVSSKRTSARHVSALFLGSVSAQKIHLLSFSSSRLVPCWPHAQLFFHLYARSSLSSSYGRCRLLQRRSYNFSEKASIIVIVRKFMVDGVLAHGTTTCETSFLLSFSLLLSLGLSFSLVLSRFSFSLKNRKRKVTRATTLGGISVSIVLESFSRSTHDL